MIPTPEFSALMSSFRSEFGVQTFKKMILLLTGVICTQGRRTVCSVLRTLGLSEDTGWHAFHRVLSRCKWNALRCSFLLLQLLVNRFLAPDEPLLIFIDETLERRRGKQIKAKGVYRDAVRSSQGFFVKSTGLRWMCCMLLVNSHWMAREWALPFLSVLCPSERYHTQKGKRHKKLSDWARQIALLLGRWLPDRKIIMLGDTSYSVIDTLSRTKDHVTWITRFRMDAALYDDPITPPPGKPGPKPKVGARQKTLKELATQEGLEWQEVTFSVWYGQVNKKMLMTSGVSLWHHDGKTPVKIRWVLLKPLNGKGEIVAILCTDPDMTAEQIVQYYVKRWNGEVTFQEVRAHLGVETQRQWSDMAIARSTPALMATFSLVTLMADELYRKYGVEKWSTAWYKKKHPTFSDALTTVRYHFWEYTIEKEFPTSRFWHDVGNSVADIFNRLAFMAARAA